MNFFEELEREKILPEPKHWWKEDVKKAISLCREELKKNYCNRNLMRCKQYIDSGLATEEDLCESCKKIDEILGEKQ